MSMLLGGARLLRENESSLKVCVNASDSCWSPSGLAPVYALQGQNCTFFLDVKRNVCTCLDTCCVQGTVRLLFQPAEEGGAGGDVMVKEGEHPSHSDSNNACTLLILYFSIVSFTVMHLSYWCVFLFHLVVAGALDGVTAAFGFHVMPHIPTGEEVAARQFWHMLGLLSHAQLFAVPCG